MDIWVVSGMGRSWTMLVRVSYDTWAQVAQGVEHLNHCLWASSGLLDHAKLVFEGKLQPSSPPELYEITLIDLMVVVV